MTAYIAVNAPDMVTLYGNDSEALVRDVVNEMADKDVSVEEAVAALRGRKGSKGAGENSVSHEKYKKILKTTEAANPLVDSLKQTGKLPLNYITKAQAESFGWKPGKALNHYAPGKQIGGDIFENTTGILPSAPNRVWYEADVGLTNKMTRTKQPGTRLLYSNDGQLYITYDHYLTVYNIGTWK